MKFFFDNCISSNLAAAMRLLNERKHHIEHLTERFTPDAHDVDWLRAIAAEPDLVLISADPSITRLKKEREVWRSTGLTSFFFGGLSDRGIWVQVHEVVRWWPQILDTAKDSERGTGYLLPFQSKKGPQVIYRPLGPPGVPSAGSD